MKKLLIIFALLAGTVSFSNAQGQGQGGGGNRMTPEERLKRALAQLEPLKLSEAQTQQASAIYVAQAKSLDSLRTAANGDMQSVMPKMTELRNGTDAKVMAILTPDQKTAYAEIIKNRPQRGQRNGGGGNPPPPPAPPKN